MNTEKDTTAIQSPYDIMNAYGTWFMLLCIRYLSRYSDYVINDFGGYAPAMPSFSEIRAQLEDKCSPLAQTWINEREIPSLECCHKGITAWNTQWQSQLKEIMDASDGGSNILFTEQLKKTFKLAPHEFDILMALAVVQYNDTYARCWRYVSGADEYAPMNANFLFRLLEKYPFETLHTALLPSSRLRRNALISIGSVPSWKSETPLAYAPIYIPNRILSFLLGEPADIALRGVKMLRIQEPSHTRETSAEKDIAQLISSRRARLGLIGYQGLGRTSALCRVAQKYDIRVLEIDLGIFLDEIQDQNSITDFICTVLRESKLQNALLCFRFMELSDEKRQILSRFADVIHDILLSDAGLRFCVTLPRQDALSREIFGELNEYIFPQPERTEQISFWHENLSHYLPQENAQNVAQEMSEGYCLSHSEVRTTIDQTLARLASVAPQQALTPDYLTETLNKTRGATLEGLASLRSTTLKLQDIVLSSEIRQTLNEILAYARYRDKVMNDWGFAKYNMSGAGLSILLSGLPGTGKTMTAQVLAHELKRALYVVDLSRVVDKYIGETEKRLAKIFDEAERSQAMLLFDEADSLFAKRTSVKSSNDRYANLEVNYLLQRLEAYSGVSILTTNFAGGLDEALARRIQFKINFPMPDKLQRIELWKRLIPPKAPLSDDVCFEALAERFEMSGGHIKNAVFRASIQAAAENTDISHDLLWDAALNEFREMGHIVRDHDDNEDYI